MTPAFSKQAAPSASAHDRNCQENRCCVWSNPVDSVMKRMDLEWPESCLCSFRSITPASIILIWNVLHISHCWGTKMDLCRHANNVWGRLWARVEGRAPALVEVYSRHPYGPPLPLRRHVLSHANASAGWDPARARGHFPRDGTHWLASLTTCFCCCPCSSPVYFSPRDNHGPRKARVSLCRPSCPASVFRMSLHNIIICTSACYSACITRCFCVLVVGQWDRKPSKVKLAASLLRGMACCEKCASEFFDQCGNCNRDVGIWDMGTRQGWVFLGGWRLEHQGRLCQTSYFIRFILRAWIRRWAV